MSNLAGSAVYSSANTSTSTLRPRNNRLISYLDESSAENDQPSQSKSTSSSRGGSPSSAQARARNVTSYTNNSSATNDNGGRRPSGLWGSWASIQGVTSFLSGDTTSSSSKASANSKTPAWMKQDPRFRVGTAASAWGSSTKDSKEPEAGSIEERQAMVQAKKREALLQSCLQEGRDELGNLKRKASYDASRNSSISDTDMGKDALVYKHKVKPTDTMAGVTIKYSCQPEAFRKINRFWPNDNIQTRSYVLLPVEACSIRGRKLDDITSFELLTSRLQNLKTDSVQGSDGHERKDSTSTASPTFIESPPAMSTEEADHRHDSFVMLPSFPDPVEIIRMPRKTLGYFPRARRKSNHLTTASEISTPKTSFDMLRHPPTHAAQQAALQSQHSLSHNASPVRHRGLTPPSRGRSASTTATSNTTSNNAWLLRGPGGVGTLRGLRTEVSRPGPAEDPLNQKFTQYFPGLSIQADTEDPPTTQTPRSNPTAKPRSPYKITPRASTDSIRSTRSNSSTFGAGVTGVENFMRKLATGKRPDMSPRSSSANLLNPLALPVGRETGLGDLIELENSPDALHMGRGDGNGSGPGERVGRTMRRSEDEDDDATPTEVSGNQEDLLNARFPIRGRITRAYADDA